MLGCVTQCSQSAAHSCEQFLVVQQIRFVSLGPLCCALRRLPRYCIIVTWWSGPGGIEALSERPSGFLQCFDTIGYMTCENRPRNDLWCVWWDVKPCSINQCRPLPIFIYRMCHGCLCVTDINNHDLQFCCTVCYFLTAILCEYYKLMGNRYEQVFQCRLWIMYLIHLYTCTMYASLH